jgi:large subunit ribosomal protein L10
MTKAEKTAVIEALKEKIADSPFFYITDSSTLTVEQVTDLRRKLFEEGIEMKVVKNTLTRKALEAIGDQYEPLFESLKGPTALMFTDVANKPAKIIKDFRKSHDKPLVKAAYIDTAIYIGDDELDSLATIKSKEELIGEIIGILQSPMKTVVGQLKSGGNTLMGLLKAMEERGE